MGMRPRRGRGGERGREGERGYATLTPGAAAANHRSAASHRGAPAGSCFTNVTAGHLNVRLCFIYLKTLGGAGGAVSIPMLVTVS